MNSIKLKSRNPAQNFIFNFQTIKDGNFREANLF